MTIHENHFTHAEIEDERRQVAALPYRAVNGRVQILLITSRGTGRWVLPKGWIERGEKPARAAAREALEEAGVIGKVSRKGVGIFSYDKRLDSGPCIDCRVEVYGLAVERQLTKFKEAGERMVEWFDYAEAADAVKETGLADLIFEFGRANSLRKAV